MTAPQTLNRWSRRSSLPALGPVEPPRGGSRVAPPLLLVPAFASTLAKSAGINNLLGVDLTILGVLCALLGALLALPGRELLPRSVPLLLWLVCMLPAFARTGTTEYAQSKTSLLLLISLPLALSAGVIAQRDDRLEILLRVVVIIGLATVAVGLLRPETSADLGRLSIGSNTLGPPYLIGAAVVAVVTMGKWRLVWALPSLVLLVPAMLLYGSRGPIVGLVVSLAAGLFLNRLVWGKTPRGMAAVALALAVLAFGAYLLARATPLYAGALNRIGQSTFEDAVRSQILAQAWEVFLAHPVVGVGMGNFTDFYFGYDNIRYPHNLFADVLVDAGLVGLLAFACLLSVTLYRSLRFDRRSSYSMVSVTMLLYWLLGLGQFSADLADKWWLIWVAVVLLRAPTRALTSPSGSPPVGPGRNATSSSRSRVRYPMRPLVGQSEPGTKTASND